MKVIILFFISHILGQQTFEKDGLIYYSSQIPEDEIEYEKRLREDQREGREKIRKKAVMDALETDMISEANDMNLPAPYGGVNSKDSIMITVQFDKNIH